MNYITEKEMINYFSQNLKQLRSRRTPPVTQQQLATRLHVDRGLIAKYESGLLLPSVCLALNLAHYFDTTVESLFTEQWEGKERRVIFENITPHNTEINKGRKVQNY